MNTPSRATAEINMGMSEKLLGLAPQACKATETGTGTAMRIGIGNWKAAE